MFHWDHMDILGDRARCGTCTHSPGSVQIHKSAHVTHTCLFSLLFSQINLNFFLGRGSFPSSTSPFTWVGLLYMKDEEDKIISPETQTLDTQEKREEDLYLKSAEGPFLWKPGEGFCEAQQWHRNGERGKFFQFSDFFFL